MNTSVGRRLREDDLPDWGCGVALEGLFVEVLWDVGDKSLSGWFICCESVV